MRTFQLVRRDEYGSTSIYKRSEDVAGLVNEAKKLVTQDNIENALTYDEKLRNWESAYIEFFDEEGQPTTELIFGGQRVNKLIAYSIDGENVEEITLQSENIKDPNDIKGRKQKPSMTGIGYGVKVFVGTESPKKGQITSLYALRDGKNQIDYVTLEVLQGKSIYYLQLLK